MTVRLLAIKLQSYIKFAKVQHALICVCTEMQITCLQKIVNNKNVNLMHHRAVFRINIIRPDSPALSANTDDFQSMTKEELIRELLKARIAEARLKKGYAVKGDGTVILYGKKNTK